MLQNLTIGHWQSRIFFFGNKKNRFRECTGCQCPMVIKWLLEGGLYKGLQTLSYYLKMPHNQKSLLVGSLTALCFTLEVAGFTLEVTSFTSEVAGFTSEVDGFTSEVDGFTSEVDGFTLEVASFTSDVVDRFIGNFSLSLGDDWFLHSLRGGTLFITFLQCSATTDLGVGLSAWWLGEPSLFLFLSKLRGGAILSCGGPGSNTTCNLKSYSRGP